MKKPILIIHLVLLSLFSFSQKSNISKAKQCMEQGKYEIAREYIDQAVENPKTGDNKEAWFVRGNIYHFLSRESSNPLPLMEASYKSFKKAENYGYKNQDLLIYYSSVASDCYNHGVSFYNKGKYDKAMGYFYLTYKINGTSDIESLYNAALCAELAENIPFAAKYYTELYFTKFDKEDLYIRAPVIIAKNGNKNLALKMVKEGKEKYPDNSSIVISEINIYLALGDDDKIFTLVRKAIEGNAGNASLYLVLGNLYEEMDGYRYETENAYKKAIEIDPNLFEPYYNLGALYLNTAADIQIRANDLSIDKIKEYDELVSQSNKNLEIAVPYLEKAYQLQPEDEILVNSLRESYIRLKFNDKLEALNNNTLLKFLNKQIVNKPPEIVITSPSNSRGFKILDPYSTTESSITIAGQAIDDNGIKQITFNGRSIPFDGDGYFSQPVGLTDGFNSIHIKATDLSSNESQIELYFEKGVKTKGVATLQLEEETVASGSTYYAILIGVNDYSDPAINDLDNPVKDTERFFNVITSYYTFEKGNIIIMTNPTRDELYDTFEEYIRILDEDDNLLIFYAGHGFWDESLNRGYWLPSDANPARRGSWFSNNDLTGYIRGFKSKHTLLISDACFSGSIFKTRAAFDVVPKDIKLLREMPSRTAITSGTLTEVPDKSVFIDYLVKRLQQNTEKFLTTEGLFNSFRRAVISNSVTDQVPQYGSIHLTGDEGGEFIFIRK